MKNFIKYLLICLCPLLSNAQDSASVLFIGNSYTSYNNLPGLFQDLSSSLGKSTYVDSKLNGGATMQVHANDPVSYQKITVQIGTTLYYKPKVKSHPTHTDK